MTRNLLLAGLTALALITPACAQQPTRFTVTVTGEGPDVILIPGLSSSSAVWADTIKQLSPTHRVHAVQVNGFAGAPTGENAKPGALQGLVSEIGDYAAKLDHPALIGHSLGGLTALEVAAQKPDAVSRVLVVDALPFYALIMNPAATSDMVKPQAEMMRAQIVAQTQQQYAAGAPMTAASLVKSAEAQALVQQWFVATDKAAAAQMMYDDIITDARADLPKIKAKVTVVYAYDAIMGPEARVDGLYKSAYANLPEANLVRIDNGYHFIMLDQPAAFAQAVANFLK